MLPPPFPAGKKFPTAMEEKLRMQSEEKAIYNCVESLNASYM